MAKEALGEYFLYTVGGRDTIANGWSKRLPSFNTAEVPITSYYKYEKERFGPAVMRFYKFKNDEKSKLGKEPLPYCVFFFSARAAFTAASELRRP